jgi:hypothetical protein
VAFGVSELIAVIIIMRLLKAICNQTDDNGEKVTDRFQKFGHRVFG